MKMHRSIVVAAILGSCAGLAGCKASDTAAPQGQTATENANELGPDAKPGVTAGAARLVLPILAGRPGVAYFRVANTSKAAITLVGVHLDGVGKAEMHRTSGGSMTPVEKVDIASGASIAFVPGGLHVMAFDVSETLKAGDKSELTLTFSDGDKVSVPVKIEAIGSSEGKMGMKH